MIAWLSQQSAFFQVLLIIALIVVAFLVCLVCAKRNVIFRRGKCELRIGGNGNKKISPHKRCSHAKDIVILLNKSLMLISEKERLVYVERLRTQMNYVELKLNIVKNVVQDSYLELLRTKNEVNNVVSSNSFLSFKLILHFLHHDLLDHFRVILRDDSMLSMDERSFREYSEDMIVGVINRYNEMMCGMYYYGEDVSQSELYTSNRGILNKTREIIADILENSRSISVACNDRIKQLDATLENLIGEFV